MFINFLYAYIKRVNKYYQKKNKKNLQKEACERYQIISEEEKENEKKRQYHRNPNLVFLKQKIFLHKRNNF